MAMYDLNDLYNPEISLEDKKQVLLLDFLTKARLLCPTIRVKDLEPFLEAFGLPVNGPEHFILVMTDQDVLREQGANLTQEELTAQYPCWKENIAGDFYVRTMALKIKEKRALEKLWHFGSKD